MKIFRLTLLALAFSSFASVALAQQASDHNAHHPADTLTQNEAPAQTSAKPVDAAPLLGQMDAQLANMQQLHQKFQNASPEERRTLMAENRTIMQEGMKLMGAASDRTGGMGMMGISGKTGQGMMGGMNPGTDNQSAAPGSQMTQGMMQHHELMSKRMDMMQSMMQMVVDRMDAGN